MLTTIVQYILTLLGFEEENEVELYSLSPHAALDAILEETCDCISSLRADSAERTLTVAKQVADIASLKSNSGHREALIEYMCSITPDLEKILKMPFARFTQLMGSTQTQKTSVIISLVLTSIIQDTSAVVVVRDYTCDAVQLQNRLKDYLTKLDYACPLHSHILDFFSLYRADKLETKTPLRQPCCIIALGNDSQLSSVLNNLHGYFNLILDENDEIDCALGSKTAEILQALREGCVREFGVTATPLDVVAHRKELCVENLLCLTNPPDYRGHKDIEVEVLSENIESAVYTRRSTFTEMCAADSNLLPFLHSFASSENTYSDTHRKYYPNICLLKVTDLNDNQAALYGSISKLFQTEDHQSLVVVESNSAGFRVSVDWRVPTNDAFVERDTYYTHGVISDVLQALKNLGNVSHILIVAGRKAKRSQSFTTRDYDWHLTDMYYIPARATSIPTMWQDTGRLTGRNKYKSHLRLHCTQEVKEAIHKGILLTQELLERSVQNTEASLSVFDSLRYINVAKMKIPRRKLCHRVNSKLEFGVVESEDNGWSTDLYVT